MIQNRKKKINLKKNKKPSKILFKHKNKHAFKLIFAKKNQDLY
jgi:hypothetical protein